MNIVQGLSGSSTNLETLNVSRLINFVQKLHEWGWPMNERESISTMTTNEPIFTVLLNDFIPHGMSVTNCTVFPSTVHCLPKWFCFKYTSHRGPEQEGGLNNLNQEVWQCQVGWGQVQRTHVPQDRLRQARRRRCTHPYTRWPSRLRCWRRGLGTATATIGEILAFFSLQIRQYFP